MSLSFSWFFSLEQNENSKEEKAGTKHYVSTAHSKFRISCVLLSCGAVGSQSDWHLLGDFTSKGRNWKEWKKSHLRESHSDGPLLSGAGTRRQEVIYCDCFYPLQSCLLSSLSAMTKVTIIFYDVRLCNASS